MNTELSTEISPEIINSLILTGDMSKLTAPQQTQYYGAVCKSLGLNPLTQPFAIIVLQGKKTLYALKACTQQLCGINKINTEVKDRKTVDSIYMVSARATMPDGRFTDDDGIVAIAGLKGPELANAMMKAVTKAKRRAVLALCGLGMPDETEVDDEQMAMMRTVDPNKSRVEQIIDTQVTEVVNEPQKEEPKKTTKTKPKDAPVVNADAATKTEQAGQKTLTEGHKLIQGVITTPPTFYPEVGEANKPKWVFKMGDLKLGTFDESIFKGITDIMDSQGETPILLNIEYKERPSGEKILRDIIGFSQATKVDVPI